mgnify:CR=1 FL=1
MKVKLGQRPRMLEYPLSHFLFRLLQLLSYLLLQQQNQKQRELHSILSNFTILEFNNLVSFRAADIYRQPKSQNKLIEFRDIFIAATCLEYQQPLLTFNHKHFTRISGLELVRL